MKKSNLSKKRERESQREKEILHRIFGFYFLLFFPKTQPQPSIQMHIIRFYETTF